MRLTLFKKLLLTLFGVGVVSSLVSVGTFASFTATTNNPGNTFSAGTLTMSNSGRTPCTTSGNGEACGVVPLNNANYGSGTTGLVSSTDVTNIEPGAVVTGTITIKNDGTLPAKMAVYFKDVAGTAGANTSACNGTCSALTDGSATAGNNQLVVGLYDTSTSECIYGVASPPAASVCDSTITGGTALNASSWNIAGAPNTSGTALAIPGGALLANDQGNAPTKWGPGESHTFTVYVTMPTDAGNAYQGGNGKFDIYWYAQQ